MVARLVAELERLIAIPTDRDCLPFLDYLEERLPFIPFERQPVPKEVEGRRQCNLVAIDPSRPFLVNTHVDTVPPITMEEPFRARVRDGKIYGRGAADTKGLIAALILALEDFHRENPSTPPPVSLAFTVDEENHTALGSESLLERLDPIEAILVLEPTYGRPCLRQLGSLEFELEVRAPSCHAATFSRFPNPAKWLLSWFQEAERVLDRPLNLIRISSGWDHYAVPDRAILLAEVQLTERDDPRGIERKLRTLAEQMAEDVEVTYRRIDVEPFLQLGEEGAFTAFLQAYRETVGEPEPATMPSWTDAANFAKKPRPCLVWGEGKLEVAHTEREHITLEELRRNYEVLSSLLRILSQSPTV